MTLIQPEQFFDATGDRIEASVDGMMLLGGAATIAGHLFLADFTATVHLTATIGSLGGGQFDAADRSRD